MAAQFVLKGQDKPVIEWETKVDDDGDLVAIANGVSLFYVSACTGKLYRYYSDGESQAKLPGLVFNDEGEIELD